MAPPNKTRKYKNNGQVLNVRSDGAVKLFEKALVKGPLTLVYVNAKWCGACHRFNDEVWSTLTKLKNKSVNLASVDSEYIGKTSLANVPRNFYPTLMLVGKDKKPATFKDENGQPTNAMPRNSTLSEDREALSNLVINPTVKSNLPMVNSPMVKSPTVNSSMVKSPTVNSPMVKSPNMVSIQEYNKNKTRSITLPNIRNSPSRAIVSVNNLAKSPFEPRNNKTMNKTLKLMSNTKTIASTNPPDIGSDLVASQTKSPTPSAILVPEPIKGGGLLGALKNKTAQMKSLLNVRKHLTRRNRK
jgi:thiol-disulfide isomerase/thioredoxin